MNVVNPLKNLFVAGIAALLPTIMPTVALGQDEYISSPGLYNFTSDDLVKRIDAVKIDETEIQLTQVTSRQSGFAELPSKICAKEYRLKASVFLGETTHTGAGLWISLVRDTSLLSGPGPWGERYYKPINANKANTTWAITFDTSRDYYNGAWEQSDNQFKLGGNIFTEDGGFTDEHRWIYLYGNLPWRLKGGGWHDVELYFNEGSVQTIVNQGGLERINRTDPNVYFKAGEAVTPIVGAFTGAAYGDQRVRDLSLQIVRGDDCSESVPAIDVQQVVEDACGVYDPAEGCPTECIHATLEPLMLAGRVTLSQLNSLLAVCVEPKDCSLEEAVAQQSGYNEGYSAGVDSIDTVAIRTAGYNEGFVAGTESVHLPSVREVAYSEGYLAGQQSVVCEEPEAPSPTTLTEEQVRSLWTTSCSCAEAANHGEYVSCTANMLKQLLTQNLIGQELSASLQVEAAQSTCGKPEKLDHEDEERSFGQKDASLEAPAAQIPLSEHVELMRVLEEKLRTTELELEGLELELSQKAKSLKRVARKLKQSRQRGKSMRN